MLEVAGEPAAEHRPGQKARERDNSGRHVDAGVWDEPETEEDDVPGHVRHKDMPQHEHADRVDETGRERQRSSPVTVICSETGEVTGTGACLQLRGQVQRGHGRHPGDAPVGVVARHLQPVRQVPQRRDVLRHRAGGDRVGVDQRRRLRPDHRLDRGTEHVGGVRDLSLLVGRNDRVDELAVLGGEIAAGDFAFQYRKFIDSIVATNKQAQVTNTTSVLGTAVESVNQSEASAVVYTNSVSTSPVSKNIPSLRYLSYRLEMKRDRSDWRITRMTTITTLDLTPQL